MDVPPPAGAGPDQLVAHRPAPGPGAGLSDRLDAVEAALSDMGARLEALAQSLPAAVQAAVAPEVQAVAADLRHTVSELGRLLVRDLGKLSQILSQHRDAIVAELKGPGAGPSRPTPAETAAAPTGDAPVADAGPDDTEDEPADSDADAGAPRPAGGAQDDAGAENPDVERPWRRRRRQG